VRWPHLNILYLATGVFDKGGISRYSRFQLRALRELYGAGAVHVVSMLGPGPRDFEEPIAVAWHGGRRRRLSQAGFLAAWGRASVGETFDLIWGNAIQFAPLAFATARLSRMPMVVNIYGSEMWSHPRRLDVSALRRADAIVSDCRATMEYTRRRLRAPASQFEVHLDCVDLERYSPGCPEADVLVRYGLPPPDPARVRILTLGRINQGTRYKGYEQLLAAFARLARELPLDLVFGGDGDLVPDLERQARELGVRHRVYFTRLIAEADLPDVYRACDLFSLVTRVGFRAGEGIPLTPLEAAACGKPIIVGNQDGSREAVEHEATGVLLDPDRDGDLREALRRLSTDAGLRAQMGCAGRRRMEQHHGYPAFRDRLYGLVERLLSAGRC
jgi:phosphatidyl-myo-inositol dimannoside synthase